MSGKRYKIVRGVSSYIPTAVDFSSLEKEYDEGNESYAPSDNGMEQERLEDNLVYEEMIVQILYGLEMKEKLIFIYQLMRDFGYQIDHASFARTLKLSRRQYMRLLDEVRVKSALMIYGYQQRHKGK